MASAAAPLVFGQTEPAGAARVRSMMRLFVSEVEDKPWFL